MNSRYRNSSVLSLGGIVVLTLLLSLVVSRVPYEMSIALVIGVCVLVVSFLYAEAVFCTQRQLFISLSFQCSFHLSLEPERQAERERLSDWRIYFWWS